MSKEKTQYEFELLNAKYKRYNASELIKPENSRVLFEVINEAKQYNEVKSQLDIANKKLDKIKEKLNMCGWLYTQEDDYDYDENYKPYYEASTIKEDILSIIGGE